MPGPLQDVEWMPSGLKVLKLGIYEISYKVVLETKVLTCNPSKFNVMSNHEFLH